MIEFGSTQITIPKQMLLLNKNGLYNPVNTLTKSGNLTTRNGKKSIKFVSNDDRKIIINDEGNFIPNYKRLNETQKVFNHEKRILKKNEKKLGIVDNTPWDIIHNFNNHIDNIKKIDRRYKQNKSIDKNKLIHQKSNIYSDAVSKVNTLVNFNNRDISKYKYNRYKRINDDIFVE